MSRMSCRLGSVSGGRARPDTSAPSSASQKASHAPLKPVWPVTRTRRPAQNARHHQHFQGARPSPDLLEIVAVAQRIHRLEEAFVAKAAQLAVFGQLLERLLLPDRLRRPRGSAPISGESTKKPPLTKPPSPLGFSRKPVTRSPSQFEHAEPPRRIDGRDGRQSAVRAVESDGGRDVDVGDAVAVGQAEGVALDVFQDAREPAARHRRLAGVDQRDAPVLGFVAMRGDGAAPLRSKVTSDMMQRIVGEEFLDQIALVAEADDEIGDAMRGVDFHDVPENGRPPISTSGFGRICRLFGEFAPNPPAKITACISSSVRRRACQALVAASGAFIARSG